MHDAYFLTRRSCQLMFAAMVKWSEMYFISALYISIYIRAYTKKKILFDLCRYPSWATQRVRGLFGPAERRQGLRYGWDCVALQASLCRPPVPMIGSYVCSSQARDVCSLTVLLQFCTIFCNSCSRHLSLVPILHLSLSLLKAHWCTVVHVLKYSAYLGFDWLRLASAVIGYTSCWIPVGLSTLWMCSRQLHGSSGLRKS